MSLHPGAWWSWALLLAASAATSPPTAPIVPVCIMAIAITTVYLRRSPAPWALQFRLYLWMAALLCLLRVVWRLIFSSSSYGTVLVPLPGFALPGLTLLGPITLENLLGGLYDGLRLAAVVVCVGAANSLADPKRLIRNLPKGLQEIGTALTVTLSVFPQLAEATTRVTRARRYRSQGKVTVPVLFKEVAVPVMMDALDGSLNLAASMSVRGYDSRPRVRSVQLLLLASAVTIFVALFFLLSPGTFSLGLAVFAFSSVLLAASLVLAGRRINITRYMPDPWTWLDWLVSLCSLPLFLYLVLVQPFSFTLVLPLCLAVSLLSLLAPRGVA